MSKSGIMKGFYDELKSYYSEAKKMQESYYTLLTGRKDYSNKRLKVAIRQMFKTPTSTHNKAEDATASIEQDLIKEMDNILETSGMVSALEKNTYDLLAREIGINQKNVKKAKTAEALKDANNILFGNILEYIRVEQLVKYVKANHPDWKVYDTAPHNEFGESVKYDIRIEIPDETMGLGVDSNNITYALGNLRFESKAGGKLNTPFKIGTVSSKTLTDSLKPNSGGLDYYKDLEKMMDDILWNGVLSGNRGSESIRIEEKFNSEALYMQLGIAYVKWRLNNNFPIFLRGTSNTSITEDQILLCTEFIWNLSHDVGMTVDFDVKEDALEFTISRDTYNRNKEKILKNMHRQIWNNINKITTYYGKA